MRKTPAIFLLMDISGYTPFVRLHKLNLLHAEKVITDLLEVIIEIAQPPLKVNRIEGDAVFFYAELGDNPVATAENVMRQTMTIMEAFVEKAMRLDGINICICDACSVVKDLKLKGFLHAGEAVIKKVAQYEELGGEDIILAHKLMKNDVPSSEYLLVTSAFGSLTEMRPSWSSESRVENHEGFGETAVEVYYCDADCMAMAVRRANEASIGIGAKLGRIWELMLFTFPRVFGLGK
jgi:hypothetical protein